MALGRTCYKSSSALYGVHCRKCQSRLYTSKLSQDTTSLTDFELAAIHTFYTHFAKRASSTDPERNISAPLDPLRQKERRTRRDDD
jgi:hypothetical protein